MARHEKPALPTELWAHIMDYCSTNTLKALALVSRSFCDEARKCLYHSVFFCEGNRHSGHSRGTCIRDLSAFRYSLLPWSDWRRSLHHAHLCWANNAPKHPWGEPTRPANESDISLDRLVVETANLLSGSHTLKTLHLSPPLLDSAVPFAIKRLDSLTIPISNSLYYGPDFAKLLKLFQIPSLRKVKLDQMLRLNYIVPDNCRQPGTSNVVHLEFFLCGPVSEDIAHLLSWPKDLQTLVFKEGMGEGLNRFVYDCGDTSALRLQEALRPVEKTVQDLDLDLVNACSDGLTDGPLPNDAFQSFTKLRRLRIPINMLIELEDDEEDYDDNELMRHGPTWSIHSQFPHCIEELEFVISEAWWWGDWETNVPSKETKDLFAYVSGLVDGNGIHYPNLKKVLISNELGDFGYGYNDTRVERDYVREFIDRLQSSGISVSIFHPNL